MGDTRWALTRKPASTVPADETLLMHPTENRPLTAEEMTLFAELLRQAATLFFSNYKTRAYEALNDFARVYENAVEATK